MQSTRDRKATGSISVFGEPLIGIPLGIDALGRLLAAGPVSRRSTRVLVADGVGVRRQVKV